MSHTDNKPGIVCEPVWTPTPENIEKLFAHLAHGDAEHRRWLREHLYLFFGVAAED
jgi:hypothetical protein